MRTYVNEALRREILERDGGCVLRDQPGHVCKTIFGREHAGTDLKFCTIEHVKEASAMGVRAPSDLAHCVALCGITNNKPPSKVEREIMRDHLRALYPGVWPVLA